MQNFVEHDSQRPDIALDRIVLTYQGFRTHVQRTPDILGLLDGG
jgi:hypothetical protein